MNDFRRPPASRDDGWQPPVAIRASVALHVAAALAVVAVAIRWIMPGELPPWAAAAFAASIGAVVANHVVLTVAGLCPRCSLIGTFIGMLWRWSGTGSSWDRQLSLPSLSHVCTACEVCTSFSLGLVASSGT